MIEGEISDISGIKSISRIVNNLKSFLRRSLYAAKRAKTGFYKNGA